LPCHAAASEIASAELIILTCFPSKSRQNGPTFGTRYGVPFLLSFWRSVLWYKRVAIPKTQPQPCTTQRSGELIIDLGSVPTHATRRGGVACRTKVRLGPRALPRPEPSRAGSRKDIRYAVIDPDADGKTTVISRSRMASSKVEGSGMGGGGAGISRLLCARRRRIPWLQPQSQMTMSFELGVGCGSKDMCCRRWQTAADERRKASSRRMERA
jgi:hypothetical protein